MKKKTIFASVLLLLLLSTSTAFARPPKFTEFTTTGESVITRFESLPGGRTKSMPTHGEKSDPTACKVRFCFLTGPSLPLRNGSSPTRGTKARNGGTTERSQPGER